MGVKEFARNLEQKRINCDCKTFTPAHNIMYYVYILKNQAKNEIYIGYSNDLQQRLKEHRSKNPELVYYEAYKSEQDARIREAKLKQHGQTKRRLKERIQLSLI